MPSSIVIAYLGDAVYELYVRKFLITQNIGKIKDIQKKSIEYVSAKSQRIHLEKLINDNFFLESELEDIKHGRNIKGGKSKSTDIITYRIATGLEYLIGKLYLEKKIDRIELIMNYILGGE